MKNLRILVLTIILVAIVGGIFFIQQRSVTTPIGDSNSYQDAYLSLEYPDGVELLFEKPLGGRSDSQGIEFLLYDEETDSYRSTGLRLSYVVALGESESSSFTSLDEITAFYDPYDLEITEYSVDGRKALRVITGDMTGQTFFLVIPSNTPGDAYRFNGSFINERVEQILSRFLETAELVQ